MTRAFACLFAAVTLLAGAGHAQAQNYDIMSGGPNFFGGGGSGPIPRTLVNFDSHYAPGTIFISTAERRLYFVLPGGQALRYGIGVGRDGFRWGGVHRISAKKEWPSWTPPSEMLAPASRFAAPHGRRHRQPARRPRDVSGLDALSHSRLERAGNHRPGGIVRLLPHDQ